MSVNGSVDTVVFLHYLNEALAPQLWTEAVVVMDNLKVHHAHCTRSAIQALGARVVFLSPYSSDFSSIKNWWSKIKEFLRSRSVRTYAANVKAIGYTDALRTLQVDFLTDTAAITNLRCPLNASLAFSMLALKANILMR